MIPLLMYSIFQMGWNGEIRHSGQHQLHPGDKWPIETHLHGPFTRFGQLLHRHDQTPRIEGQNRPDDCPIPLFNFLPFQQLPAFLLPIRPSNTGSIGSFIHWSSSCSTLARIFHSIPRWLRASICHRIRRYYYNFDINGQFVVYSGWLVWI